MNPLLKIIERRKRKLAKEHWVDINPEQSFATISLADIESHTKETIKALLQAEIDLLESKKTDWEKEILDKYAYLNEKTTKKEAELAIISLKEKLLPCPFCGNVPEIETRVQGRGHFSVRKSCCQTVGQDTQLFFTKEEESQNYGLWASMTKWQVFYWNDRKNQALEDHIKTLRELQEEI